MLKSIVSIETINDDEKNNTYVVTKYIDNTMRIKIYKKNTITSVPQYIKTILSETVGTPLVPTLPPALNMNY
jgi:hypothetical protein